MEAWLLDRVIRFEQSYWMKPYIMLNTKLRTTAKNEFEKEFFKHKNNSILGKSMQNIRNHKDMKLVTSQKKYAKYVIKPNFEDGYLFSKELFAVRMGNTKITMNKAVYLEQAIVDLSKILIYGFCYGYMQPKYGSKLKLCYMDTYSFVYEIEKEDFYKDRVCCIED